MIPSFLGLLNMTQYVEKFTSFWLDLSAPAILIKLDFPTSGSSPISFAANTSQGN
jgi:hypothetical protein